MKKTIILIICIVFTQSLQAQKTDYLEKYLFKLNLITPSIEFETRLGIKSTLDFKLGTGISINGGSGRKTEWDFLPVGEIQYRYFYNMEKRSAKGKTASNNSGNYAALISNFQSQNPLFKDKIYDNPLVSVIGAAWGFQRTPKKSFSYGLQLGAGYEMGSTIENKFIGMIDFNLGWVL